MNKILILGGFGFLGKNLNEKLKKENFKIFNESRRTNCDVTNFNSICNKLKVINPNIIIFSSAHVGSIDYVTKNSAQVVHDNTLMYINLYKAIAEINRDIIVINPISNCSYPGVIDIQNEINWWDGKIHESVESFGNPKKMGYIISECYRKQYGIKTINLILPNAYGPFDYLSEERTHAMNGIIIRMLKSMKNNSKKFNVWGTGNPIREWIYMPDAAEIVKNILIEKKYDLPNPINLGKQNGISIQETVEIIKSVLNYDCEIEYDTTKQDGAPIKILGKSEFNKYFPNFVFTDYLVGIEHTINYYKEKIL